MSAELGSTAQVIMTLTELQCSDEDILGLLEIIRYSTEQKVEVLSTAGWSDNRIIAAVSVNSNTSEFNYRQKDQTDVKVLNFLLASELSKTRIMAALHYNNCLYPRVLHLLRKRGWSELDTFQSIVEAECFNKRTYNILIGLRDKNKHPLWDDVKFMRLMDELALSDSKRISFFIGTAIGLERIYKLFEKFGWSPGRIISAFLEAGVTPGVIVTTYILTVKDKLRVNKDLSRTQLAIEIKASKIIAVKLLEQMAGADFDVVRELDEQDWTNLDIIDYLLTAEWTPERIIHAMKQLGRTEFYLARAIQELVDGYECRTNDYWDDEVIQFWTELLRQEFSEDEQLVARF